MFNKVQNQYDEEGMKSNGEGTSKNIRKIAAYNNTKIVGRRQ
jgi:hypothetical protein